MNPVYNEFYKIWVHPGQTGFWGAVVAAEMLATNYYHHQNLKREAPNIIDVGAHYGIYTRFVATRYPKGRVFAVEPHPENVQIAKENISGLRNVTLIEGAVTYEDHVVLYPFRYGYNSGGSQVVPPGGKTFENNTAHGPPLQIQGCGLEHLMKFYGLDRIDLLKLDCEGSEYSILSKCSCLDLVDEIVGEWHRVPDIPPFNEFCAKHLPDWNLEIFSDLSAPLGTFRLTHG